MKDILNTHLDTIESSLASIKDFNILDHRRLMDLEKLTGILKGILEDARTGYDTVKKAERNLNDIKKNLGTHSEQVNKIVETLGYAKGVTEKAENRTTSAVDVVNDLMEHRLRVEKSQLYKIAEENILSKIKKINKKITAVRGNILKANSNYQEEASKIWKNAWQDYWRDIYTPSRELFGDYVDLMRGLAIRDSKLDNEICELADEMISKWSLGRISLTIPVKFVALESTVARIIRLGYLDWSTWSLPMVAREVSYVIHSREVAKSTINDYIYGQASGDKQKEIHLRDYLADIFATYVMGPAYAYASVYLRFEPPHSTHANGGHIPDSHRAEAIFNMLEWMSKEKGFVFDEIINELRSDWQKFLIMAGSPDQIEQQEKDQITAWVEDLAQCVYDNDEGGQMYSVNQWHRAGNLKRNFEKTRSFNPESTDDVRNILNSAWLVRGDTENLIDEIDHASTVAIREIQGKKTLTPVKKPQSEFTYQGEQKQRKDPSSWSN